MIGSALAGMFISSQGVKAASIGVGGLPGFLSIFPEKWGVFFIGMIIVLVVPFVLTILFGKMRKEK
ncbi:PTS system trehalose-specific EIIBC component [compost metagenome]